MRLYTAAVRSYQRTIWCTTEYRLHTNGYQLVTIIYNYRGLAACAMTVCVSADRIAHSISTQLSSPVYAVRALCIMITASASPFWLKLIRAQLTNAYELTRKQKTKQKNFCVILSSGFLHRAIRPFALSTSIDSALSKDDEYMDGLSFELSSTAIPNQ